MGRVGSYAPTPRTRVSGNHRKPLSLSVKERLQNRVPPNSSLQCISERIVLMEWPVTSLAAVIYQVTDLIPLRVDRFIPQTDIKIVQ
jgi:hypothetical protein